MSEMPRTDERVLDGIAEQAATWFVENRSGALSDEERASFMAWLRTSPIHVQEYLGVAALTGDLAAAVGDSVVSPESLIARARGDVDNVVDLVRKQPTRVRAGSGWRVSRAWPIAYAAAAAMGLAVSVTMWQLRDGERFGLSKSYSTAHGEQSVRQLPDGSVLYLNTESAVTVRYSHEERIVHVDRGEALFHVAHDTRRRFRVSAGEAGILAVGTEFDVYRRLGTVTVTVIEGAVEVFTGAPPPLTRSTLPPPLTIGAGYQVVVDNRVGFRREVDAPAVVSWLHRQIVFEDLPLGEVADEFNRYTRTVIEIEDPDLRAVPISGVFDAYDTDSFAAFLETLGGVVVEKTPTRIRVLKHAPKTEQLPVTP